MAAPSAEMTLAQLWSEYDAERQPLRASNSTGVKFLDIVQRQ